MQNNLTRILLSILWAIVWTLMILLIYTFSLSIFWTWPNEQFSKITLIFIIFIWSIIWNSLSALFVSYSNNEKYNKIQYSMFHIFIFNFILFILSLGFYLSSDEIQNIALVHTLLSIIWTNIILESFWKEWKYILSWIYWTLLWSFLLFLILIKLIKYLDDYTIITFILLPLSHWIISSVIILTEIWMKKAEKVTKKNLF